MNKVKKENNKKQTLRNTLRTTRYMLSFVWKEKHGKIYIFTKGITSLLNALFPLVYTIIPGLIINELTNKRKINTLILYVGILITTPVISQIINFVTNKYLSKINLELSLKIETDFFDHVSKMDYETLEKPDIHILKDRAQKTLDEIFNVVNQLSSLLLAIFSLIAITSIVVTINPLILLLIVCIIYVNSLIKKRVNYKKHFLSQELSKYDLYQGAYTYMLEDFSYAKEVRLFNINSLLINMLTESKTESNKLELKFQVNQGIPAAFESITNLVQQLALYAYLIYYVINKGLPIGSMTIYLAAAAQFSGSLGNVFNSYLGLSNTSLKTRELMEFLDMPLRQYKTGNKAPNYDGHLIIEFKNVSFKYPGSEVYALKNMNITIRENEKLCIVGTNGSGKSTFIKLLTRLYFPTEGEILLNGININEYDYKKYQRLFAPVFQDFAQYYMTLGKNIVLANKYNREKLDEVCSESGLLSLAVKLPKGYDTQVGKWIDPEGFNPSGGEEQRMAIARACYHGGEIFLLDEPTAALDPMAEYEIYTQFNKMITNKTAVLITHRLSAVQLADKVAVFSNGSLIEYGTHKQLYSNGGVYREMFDKQAQFYRD